MELKLKKNTYTRDGKSQTKTKKGIEDINKHEFLN